MSADQKRLADADSPNLKGIPPWAVRTIQLTANTQVKHQWIEDIHKSFGEIVCRMLLLFVIRYAVVYLSDTFAKM